MAVSNSTDFNETAVELISDALAELGVLADEEPLEDVDLQRGLRALNRMLKAWQADDVQIWTLTEGSVPLVQGDFDYLFGAGGAFTTVPFEITDCRITRGGTSLPMLRLSREEYYALPNRLSSNQGYPTQFYYDRQRSGGTMFVWPAPDAMIGTLDFTYRRIIMDMDAGPDDMDLPQEWTEAMVFGLAQRLIGPYAKAGTPEGNRVEAKAAETYQVVKNFDIGEGRASVRVTPNSHYRASRNG